MSPHCLDAAHLLRMQVGELTLTISKSRTYSVLHLGQRSTKQLPCSSASWAGVTPERRCRPSTFWLQMY